MRVILRRTALTNILCMNKTDFDTLRGAECRRDRTVRCGAACVAPWPRPSKVARLDNVFERPIHMDAAGDALPAASTSVTTHDFCTCRVRAAQ